MPAPSQLTIATSSVLRLLKEEITYHKELVDQEAKIKILEEKINSGAVASDDNQEFMLKQEVRARDVPCLCVAATADRQLATCGRADQGCVWTSEAKD